MGNFPFMALAENKVQTDLPVFVEVAYDYENNCLLYRGGKTYLLYKDDAIKVWIYKALRIARYRYAAYTHNYGNELEGLIGYVEDAEIQQSEARRYIVEALMVNPYIQEVTDFTFERTAAGLAVTFTVITLYGRITWQEVLYNE